MLLITEDAENEAKRLASQGTPLVPCGLIPPLLKHLTPIEVFPRLTDYIEINSTRCRPPMRSRFAAELADSEIR